MKVGIPKESYQNEARVAATPETVKKLCAMGLTVLVEKSAGIGASFSDKAYQQTGAELVDADQALAADIVFKVRKPNRDEISKMTPRATLVCLLEACTPDDTVQQLAKAGIQSFALERVPRISRAQTVDVLSSQSNIAGYRAVIRAAELFTRFFSMMMTSAGSAKPANVIVLGAGVAGLQAIATAKKLGARVFAYDVRPEVKEQIESLGASFVEFDLGETGKGEGGYAKQLSKETQQNQQAMLAKELVKMDIIISTAMIPCRPAPVLITEETVKGMKQGSVIIDMAAATGGNCVLSEPDKTITKYGVTICGETNLASLMSGDASSFYARNLVNFIQLLLEERNGRVRLAHHDKDEITAAAIVTHQGEVQMDCNT